jgi:prepilin-type N-terminal cleavage/methylation domain-containing protein
MGVKRCKGENVTTGARRPHGTPRFHVFTFSRFHAFTLIEMLVSLAVIALALAIVGVVFAITVKTAGQSAAYTQTHNWVRQFTQQIQEDLRHCVPSQSILVLVGRTQAAALTQDDLDARKFHRVLIGNPANVPAVYDPEYDTAIDAGGNYSNPRADLLMFFSNRPTASVAPNPADPNSPYAHGVKFAPIRVVYGHAALADPVWNAGAGEYEFPTNPALLRHIEQTIDGGTSPWVQSRIPANRWHLSRVATIIRDPGTTSFPADVRFSLGPPGACGKVPQCEPYTDRGYWLPGDAALLNLPFLLGTLGAGLTDWYGLGTPPLPPLWQPYAVYSGSTLFTDTIDSLVYGDGVTNHHVATVLEEVPVDLKSNMGVHMLPGCVWFQVEFLMPEDPRNSAEYSNPDPTDSIGGGPYSSRSDMPRWTTIEDGFTYVFVPDTPENRSVIASQTVGGGGRIDTFAMLNPTKPDTVDNRIIRLWPYAIRITVRVWDARGRLDEPIVRSIVHRFD